jgi:hypothetical protein
MPPVVEESLRRHGLRTFEAMCYMFPMPELEKDQKDNPPEAAVEIRFFGNRSGLLRIAVGSGLYSAIASNMLGVNDPAPELKTDALGEIANIVCGNLLPELTGPCAGSRIDVPRAAPLAGYPHRLAERAACRVRLTLNQGWAEMILWLDEPESVPGEHA